MNGPQFRTLRRRVQNVLDCGSLNPNYFYTSRPRPAPYNLISHETENEILWGLGLAPDAAVLAQIFYYGAVVQGQPLAALMTADFRSDDAAVKESGAAGGRR